MPSKKPDLPAKDNSSYWGSWLHSSGDIYPELKHITVPDNPLLEEASMAIVGTTASSSTHTMTNKLLSIPQEHVISSTAPLVDTEEIKAQVIKALTTTAEGKKVTPSVAALQAEVVELKKQIASLQDQLSTTLTPKIVAGAGLLTAQDQNGTTHIALAHTPPTAQPSINTDLAVQVNKLTQAMKNHTHHTYIPVANQSLSMQTMASSDANSWLH
jgi:hypothetical protein